MGGHVCASGWGTVAVTKPRRYPPSTNRAIKAGRLHRSTAAAAISGEVTPRPIGASDPVASAPTATATSGAVAPPADARPIRPWARCPQDRRTWTRGPGRHRPHQRPAPPRPGAGRRSPARRAPASSQVDQRPPAGDQVGHRSMNVGATRAAGTPVAARRAPEIDQGRRNRSPRQQHTAARAAVPGGPPLAGLVRAVHPVKAGLVRRGWSRRAWSRRAWSRLSPARAAARRGSRGPTTRHRTPRPTPGGDRIRDMADRADTQASNRHQPGTALQGRRRTPGPAARRAAAAGRPSDGRNIGAAAASGAAAVPGGARSCSRLASPAPPVGRRTAGPTGRSAPNGSAAPGAACPATPTCWAGGTPTAHPHGPDRTRGRRLTGAAHAGRTAPGEPSSTRPAARLPRARCPAARCPAARCPAARCPTRCPPHSMPAAPAARHRVRPARRPTPPACRLPSATPRPAACGTAACRHAAAGAAVSGQAAASAALASTGSLSRVRSPTSGVPVSPPRAVPDAPASRQPLVHTPRHDPARLARPRSWSPRCGGRVERPRRLAPIVRRSPQRPRPSRRNPPVGPGAGAVGVQVAVPP
jgi:hypothetical protein